MNKKVTMMTLSAVLGVGLLGTAGYSAAAAYEKTKVAKEEAVSVVEKKYGGKVTDVEFEIDDGHPEYEIEYEQDNQRYEVELDAVSGKVLDHELEDDDNEDHKNVKMATISFDEAITIALQEQRGYVTEIELDHDDSQQLIYEIEIETENGEVEIDIDAMTGAILEVEHDD